MYNDVVVVGAVEHQLCRKLWKPSTWRLKPVTLKEGEHPKAAVLDFAFEGFGVALTQVDTLQNRQGLVADRVPALQEAGQARLVAGGETGWAAPTTSRVELLSVRGNPVV